MPIDGSGGVFLSLLTESFAVRALVGSLAAAGLVAGAVKLGLVRCSPVRRLLVLAPVLIAAAAAVASFGEAFLPELWVVTASSAAAGELFELLGEPRLVSSQPELNLLLIGYGAVTLLLLLRRAAGLLAVRRLLRRTRPPVELDWLVGLVGRLARGMRTSVPSVRLLDGCPGGAFTVGVWRPVLAVDPRLLPQLDGRELEGLLAHELAHISRRDTLLGLVVGAFKDVMFFLPPVHLAARWLTREQEETADELASAYTGRPGALASGILKVWDCSRGRGRVRPACAAVGAQPTGRRRRGGRSGAAKVISTRVQRLLERPPAPTRWRRGAESVLAGGVLSVATSAALIVPGWVATELNTHYLSFGYVSVPAQSSVESPAFATFRALTGDAVVGASAAAPEPLANGGYAELPACPCVETQAQLRQGVAAVTPGEHDRMLWGSDGQLWRLQRDSVQASPLWTLSDSGPQVGVFRVGSSTG